MSERVGIVGGFLVFVCYFFNSFHILVAVYFFMYFFVFYYDYYSLVVLIAVAKLVFLL